MSLNQDPFLFRKRRKISLQILETIFFKYFILYIISARKVWMSLLWEQAVINLTTAPLGCPALITSTGLSRCDQSLVVTIWGASHSPNIDNEVHRSQGRNNLGGGWSQSGKTGGSGIVVVDWSRHFGSCFIYEPPIVCHQILTSLNELKLILNHRW